MRPRVATQGALLAVVALAAGCDGAKPSTPSRTQTRAATQPTAPGGKTADPSSLDHVRQRLEAAGYNVEVGASAASPEVAYVLDVAEEPQVSISSYTTAARAQQEYKGIKGAFASTR